MRKIIMSFKKYYIVLYIYCLIFLFGNNDIVNKSSIIAFFAGIFLISIYRLLILKYNEK